MYIIGLVGPFGSGCTFVAQLIKNKHHYTFLSLSSILRELYQERYPGQKATRTTLQDFGNEIRSTKEVDYLAKLAWEKISENPEQNYIIDSIRNPHEVDYFRKMCPNFYLFGIFADQDIRWKRTARIYEEDKREFLKDDQRDSGEKFDYGQRVTDTFLLADVVLLNNSEAIKGNDNYNTLAYKIQEKIDIIEHKKPFLPSPTETYMAMAYAISMRSSCLKRKVGAIIVDDCGNIFSSGYNEVPVTRKSCLQEYGGCYRDKLKRDFQKNLGKIILDSETRDKTIEEFKKNFKILDYCRALHAEENAILNVARVGASAALLNATLYTSTYPCNLCANKIAQVGIKKVVYFEPYPMEEAKKILLERSVKQTPFEGVTYSGYFRLMEVVF